MTNLDREGLALLKSMLLVTRDTSEYAKSILAHGDDKLSENMAANFKVASIALLAGCKALASVVKEIGGENSDKIANELVAYADSLEAN